jgi:hypothetical protein
MTKVPAWQGWRATRERCNCGGYHFPHRYGGGACHYGPRADYYLAKRQGLSEAEAQQFLSVTHLEQMFPVKPRVKNKYRDGQSGTYIGRPSKWGNPFVIGRDGDRDTVVDKYETWVRGQPLLLEAIKRELRGVDLVCFCAPQRCHGDVLLRIANE